LIYYYYFIRLFTELSRPQLVLLAMLVGSDYTSGLTGIGPVTALEILAAFPGSVMKQQSNELVVPLHKFKEWWKQREKLSPSSKLKKLATKLRDLNIHEGNKRLWVHVIFSNFYTLFLYKLYGI
jgi:DNA excision repair protein ERCC-5